MKIQILSVATSKHPSMSIWLLICAEIYMLGYKAPRLEGMKSTSPLRCLLVKLNCTLLLIMSCVLWWENMWLCSHMLSLIFLLTGLPSNKIQRSLFWIVKSYPTTGCGALKKKRWIEYGHLNVIYRIRCFNAFCRINIVKMSKKKISPYFPLWLPLWLLRLWWNWLISIPLLLFE